MHEKWSKFLLKAIDFEHKEGCRRMETVKQERENHRRKDNKWLKRPSNSQICSKMAEIPNKMTSFRRKVGGRQMQMDVEGKENGRMKALEMPQNPSKW